MENQFVDNISHQRLSLTCLSLGNDYHATGDLRSSLHGKKTRKYTSWLLSHYIALYSRTRSRCARHRPRRRLLAINKEKEKRIINVLPFSSGITLRQSQTDPGGNRLIT